MKRAENTMTDTPTAVVWSMHDKIPMMRRVGTSKLHREKKLDSSQFINDGNRNEGGQTIDYVENECPVDRYVVREEGGEDIRGYKSNRRSEKPKV